MTARDRIASLSTPSWTLAALAASVDSGLVAALDEPREIGELADRTGLPTEVVAALVELLATMDLAERIGEHWVAGAELEPDMREPQLGLLRDDLRTTVLQSLALVSTARVEPHALGGWRHTDEQLLQAQGRLSAGVAGVSIAMCRRYPAIRAVGLEPAPAPLALARCNVAAAGLRGRVELRDRRVEDLADEAAFDVAWLPGSFLSAETFALALRTVHRALRPGGLLLTGTLDPTGGDAEAAVTRLRLTLWGGGIVAPDDVVALVDAAGYVDVTAVARQSGRLVPVHARRPA